MALNIPWLDDQMQNNVMQQVSQAPVYVPPAGMDMNVLQGLQQPQLTQQDVQAVTPRAPRERRSLIDTIGRISDVLARVGGAEALYQPTLDAREDRTRQIDLDAMRQQLLQQQVQAGAEAPQEAMRARLGQALGAVASSENPMEVWGQIDPAMLGIDTQTYQAIGQRLQTNPQSAGILAGMFGYEPAKQPSLPSEIQNYGMYQRILAEQGPEAAQQFMRFVEPSAQITPYQQAQLGLSGRRINLDERRAAQAAAANARKLALDERKAEMKVAGGADLTPTQRGVVMQKLKTLPVVRQQLERVRALAGEMQQGGTFARGALGGLLPGQIAGGKAEQFDKAVGSLRKSILSLTRTPGVGSMSDYETRLDEMAIPSRWGSDEGRAEALQGIDKLISGLETGYREMVPSATPQRGSSTGAPIVRSAADYAKIKSGQTFRDPQGNLRRKP